MKLQSVSSLLFLSMCVSSVTIAAAPNIKIAGTIPATVQLNQNLAKRSLAAGTVSPSTKLISLEKVELSSEAQTYLANQADKLAQKDEKGFLFAAAAPSSLPPSAFLGMNNVPVLDQGAHGACVTFADTGAIDAIRGNTDYVSQLCNLELGSYLEEEYAKKGVEYPSGWEGSLNEIVLGQIQKYGVVNMTVQRNQGCGNKEKVLKEYPLNDAANTGVPMSDTDFARKSEPIMKDIYWKVLLSANDAFSSRANMDNVVKNIKQSIVNGHRVVFGTLLDVNDELKYNNGATGTYRGTSNDSWVVTAKIQKDAKAKKIRAGHAMIITGYDDNAEITGSDGKKHTGAFTLRNS
ncbi:hypothetical protein AQUSIP_26080 [Aquicella siphonis]|uniref:Peptidase C1A papain C-terminal domain-containing protein n=1 Tax=Aquicella siphonis TaxID=254247 RepID=A0A5E4PLJ8_9COXI|nr:C1 family peptidase [Aquicella siphonis]VVC77281.1 hypothetical protein AQUSIP_26080 [Aquicella siphonis]